VLHFEYLKGNPVALGLEILTHFLFNGPAAGIDPSVLQSPPLPRNFKFADAPTIKAFFTRRVIVLAGVNL
jgi:hypothetical protein